MNFEIIIYSKRKPMPKSRRLRNVHDLNLHSSFESEPEPTVTPVDSNTSTSRQVK